MAYRTRRSADNLSRSALLLVKSNVKSSIDSLVYSAKDKVVPIPDVGFIFYFTFLSFDAIIVIQTGGTCISTEMKSSPRKLWRKCACIMNLGLDLISDLVLHYRKVFLQRTWAREKIMSSIKIYNIANRMLQTISPYAPDAMQ